jgi:hypothetical protein
MLASQCDAVLLPARHWQPSQKHPPAVPCLATKVQNHTRTYREAPPPSDLGRCTAQARPCCTALSRQIGVHQLFAILFALALLIEFGSLHYFTCVVELALVLGSVAVGLFPLWFGTHSSGNSYPCFNWWDRFRSRVGILGREGERAHVKKIERIHTRLQSNIYYFKILKYSVF